MWEKNARTSHSHSRHVHWLHMWSHLIRKGLAELRFPISTLQRCDMYLVKTGSFTMNLFRKFCNTLHLRTSIVIFIFMFIFMPIIVFIFTFTLMLMFTFISDYKDMMCGKLYHHKLEWTCSSHLRVMWRNITNLEWLWHEDLDLCYPTKWSWGASQYYSLSVHTEESFFRKSLIESFTSTLHIWLIRLGVVAKPSIPGLCDKSTFSELYRDSMAWLYG